MYRVLAIGVNRPRASADPLQFAESDAAAIARLLTSAAVPVSHPSHAVVLQGKRATIASVRAALETICRARPRQFVLFFAGHGSPLGLALHDGVLAYSVLREKLRCMGVERCLLIFDTCHSGAALHIFEKAEPRVGGLGDAALRLGWIELLASSTPGTRVIASTEPHGLAGEGVLGPFGHFTGCLMHAARFAPPDLIERGHAYASDASVFTLAAARLDLLTQGAQCAVRRGSGADMPFCVPERRYRIGEATIADVTPCPRSLSLSFAVDLAARRFLATRLRVGLRSELGASRVVHDEWITAPSDRSRHPKLVHALDFGTDDLHRMIWHDLGDSIRLEWSIEIADVVGRLLASASVPVLSRAAA